MRRDLSALETALELRRRGLWPVALHPPGVTIHSKDGPKIAVGKEPIEKEWGKKQPTEQSLRQIFQNSPDAGVGVNLGPAGRVVDFEVDGPEGETSLLKLFGGDAVETMGWSSRRGPHALFAWDDRLAGIDPKRRAKVTLPDLPGLEMRFGQGKQSQSACPPTVGEDGLPRRWNDCDTIASLPEAAVAFLRAALTERTPQTATARPEAKAASDPTTAWFRKALAQEAGKVATAPTGARHDTLLSAARTLGGMLHHGYLTEADVSAELTHAGGRAGLPESEVAATIRDGLANGKDSPLPWPDKLDQPNRLSRHTPVKAIDTDDDSIPIDIPAWPAPPAPAAYQGLPGEFVRIVEPQSEADPLALLIHFVVMFGNMIGRGPYITVEATRHYTNENAVLVGDSAIGRKGTAGDRARDVFKSLDDIWAKSRIKGGLSSGEGLISAVRDRVTKIEPVKLGKQITGYHEIEVDPGELDKRLLILETEFGGVLRMVEREGNKLSPLLRQAWDGGTLSTLTKSPLTATDPHISIVGHITAAELLELLPRIEATNGFANRFLWVAVKRARVLPFGGRPVDLASISTKLAAAANAARDVGEMDWTPAACQLWESRYVELTTPAPGRFGSVTTRAAPHVLRLGMIYALVDGRNVVGDDHLHAALELWGASARCAAFIFGTGLEDPRAEKILTALRNSQQGLTRSEINRGVFAGNEKSHRIKAALGLLLRHGLVLETQDNATGGRRSVRYQPNERNAINERSPPLGCGDPTSGAVNSFSSFNSYTPPANGAAPRESVEL